MGYPLKRRRKASFNAVINRGSYLLILIKVEDARGIRCTRKKGSLKIFILQNSCQKRSKKNSYIFQIVIFIDRV